MSVGGSSTNIAAISDTIYSRAKNSVSLSEADSVDYADKRVFIRGGSEGATLSLKQQQWLGYTPSDGTIKIGTVTGNYPTEADIVTDDALSGLITDKYSAKLQFKGVSAIELENNSVVIGVREGSLMEMNKSESYLWADSVHIATKQNSRHEVIVNDSGVTISGLKVVGSKLSSGDPLHIDGQLIKIG